MFLNIYQNLQKKNIHWCPTLWLAWAALNETELFRAESTIASPEVMPTNYFHANYN